MGYLGYRYYEREHSDGLVISFMKVIIIVVVAVAVVVVVVGGGGGTGVLYSAPSGLPTQERSHANLGQNRMFLDDNKSLGLQKSNVNVRRLCQGPITFYI